VRVVTSSLVWLWNHRIVSGIVGVSVGLGVVLSVVEVNDRQNLATVLVGLTLIASVAILAAAITAAIYAKPAYDEAVSLLQPIHLSIVDFSLSDENGELVTTDQGQLYLGDVGEWVFNPSFQSTESVPVYQSTQPLPSDLRLEVTVFNEGKGTARCGMNFRVPAECELRPLDPETHRLTSANRYARLAPDVYTRCRLSVSDNLIPRGVNKTYAAEIKIPDSVSSWDLGWPMMLMFFRPGETENAIERMWWVSVPAARDEKAAIPGDD